MTQTLETSTTAISRVPDLRLPPRTTVVLGQVLNSKQIQSRLAEVLPSHIKVEWLTRVALMAASRNNDLLECTMDSIYRAVMEAGSLGLNPSGGVLGEAYLVPFNNKNRATDSWEKTCTLVIGYRGLIVLARRSAEVLDVDGDVVYANDHFVYKQGLTPVLEHTPSYESDREDRDIIGAWVVFRMKNGVNHPKFVPICDIEKRRLKSKGGADKSTGAPIGMWRDWYPEMCLKTAVKIGVKLVPASSEDLARALEIDNDVDVIEARTSGGAKSRTQSLLNKIASDAHPPHDEHGEIIDADHNPVTIPPKPTDAEADRIIREKSAKPVETKTGGSPTEAPIISTEAEHRETTATEPEDAIPENCTLNQVHALVAKYTPPDLDVVKATEYFDAWIQLNTKGWNRMSSSEKYRVWKDVIAGDKKFYLPI